jgi:short-subunit dehydrogenase involved in D-alanine esterification of teichoic acids
MSYIDNKSYYIKMNQILELENEMLRKQIKDLKTKINELLDPTVNEGKIGYKATNRESGRNNS